MSLSTFSALKTTMAAWLWRANDTDLTTYIPDMITMCEAELNRRLQSRRKVTRTDFTIDSEFENVPTDFGGVVAFRLSSPNPDTELVYVSPSEAAKLIGGTYNDTTGQPVFYTIIGGEFQFIPAPDGTYMGKLAYKQTIPALSDSQTTNWVLTDHPDLYLYGSLKHSAPWLREDERLIVWGGLFEAALQTLEQNDRTNQFAGQLNARAKCFE